MNTKIQNSLVHIKAVTLILASLLHFTKIVFLADGANGGNSLTRRAEKHLYHYLWRRPPRWPLPRCVIPWRRWITLQERKGGQSKWPSEVSKVHLNWENIQPISDEVFPPQAVALGIPELLRSPSSGRGT